jgi:hypothetical protein
LYGPNAFTKDTAFSSHATDQIKPNTRQNILDERCWKKDIKHTRNKPKDWGLLYIPSKGRQAKDGSLHTACFIYLARLFGEKPWACEMRQ